MNKFLLLFTISLISTGCTTIGVGTAELSGIAVLNDRRNAQTMFVDEKIEDEAHISLNLNSAIEGSSHFNVTSYNRIALITGETPTQDLSTQIATIVQNIQEVRTVKNHLQLASPTSFIERTNDMLITSRVKTAFTTDGRLPGFDSTRIKVITENGRVFLMGLVYPREGEVAADVARQQLGVREIIKVFEYLN